jgi:salicylate 5-hydroxylase large subunit
MENISTFRQNLKLAGPELLQPQREFPGRETLAIQPIWPNLIVQRQSNTLAMRQIVTRGPGAFELHWTFFGYADDDEAMTTRRLRQANLMGPAGYVSVDDTEVIQMTQRGVAPYPNAQGVLELGGSGVESADYTVTESTVRAFHKMYREIMEL